jgi:predicted nucleic acid-binding protein
MPGNFFDSNVLIYVATQDFKKSDRAQELIDAGGTISVQVLNEIVNVVRRKLAIRWNEIRAFLVVVRGLLAVEPITIAIHETGLALAERYNLST